MAPPEPPNEVTVRVKIPPGHLHGTNEEVFSLGSLSTTHPVATLRQRIYTLVPTNPPPSFQRILYGGRALIDDEQPLADALNTRREPTQTDYVVHLLVRNGGFDSTARGDTGLARFDVPAPVPDYGIVFGQPPGDIHVPSQQEMGMSSAAATPTAQASVLPADSGELSAAPHAGQTTPAPGAALNGGAQTATTQAAHSPNTAPHRYHHHHHHPQPHFHHGPHIHNHGQQSPFPRSPSSHGFHISGTGPDGQHFAIHQQTFTTSAQSPLPALSPNALHGLPGFTMPMPMPFQRMPPAGPPPMFSALDRARENMAEMRRMLEDMRNEHSASEDTRSRVAELERRMQGVNDYIDPFRVGTRTSSARGQPASATPETPLPTALNSTDLINPILAASLQQNASASPPPPLPMPTPMPFRPSAMNFFNGPHHHRHSAQHPQGDGQQSDQTSVYLLSSPQGPHALLFSPQHGTFSGALSGPQYTLQGPLATMPLAAVGNAVAAAPPPPPAPQDIHVEQPGVGQLAQAQADPLAMLQPFLGHIWLLLRISIFAYFLMGSDLGWRRPVALLLIGLGFWLIRLGLFGNGGLIRRWWDGVVQVNDVRDRLRRPGAQNAPEAAQARPNDAVDNAAQNPGQAAPRPFPTPEELAQRLIREQRRNGPLQRLREHIRPAERAAALFIASLWPGVGERYAQALDRAREEEAAAARRLIEAQREEAAREQEATQQADKQVDVAHVSKEAGEDTESAQPAEASSSEKKNEETTPDNAL